MTGPTRFPDVLRLDDFDHGREREYVLQTPFRYVSSVSGADGLITVPAGFLTDFASIPRLLWPLLPPDGPYREAAVVHDWLYWQQTTTRAVADAVMLEAMEDLGVSWPVRQAVYRGLRIGGWWGWRDDAARKAAGESRLYPVDTERAA